MENLIEIFHIDYKLLIAQMVNFGIVFVVLYYFALKPLFQTMKDRTVKIEKSLNDAQIIEKKLMDTEKEYQEIINKAKKEANAILERANEQVELQKKEVLEKAKIEIGAIINKEKAELQIEKSRTLKVIKKEIGDLIIFSLEKILEEKIDDKKDKEIIKRILSNNLKN